MATTTSGATLTAAEQAATQRLATQYAALAYALWTRWATPDDIDQNWLRIIDLLVPQILKARTQAAGTSRAYYQAFRKLEAPAAASWKPDTPLVTLDRSVIETSLRVTGPVAFKDKLKKISGADLKPEVQKALVRKMFEEAGKGMGQAVLRHVADGARKQIAADTKADPVALGWARVTKSAAPCYFCAMLASRNFVYDKESFTESNSRFVGEGEAKAHDNCACTLEPRFDRNAPLPGRAEEFSELWGKSTRGKSGQAAIIAFRRAYEGREV